MNKPTLSKRLKYGWTLNRGEYVHQKDQQGYSRPSEHRDDAMLLASILVNDIPSAVLHHALQLVLLVTDNADNEIASSLGRAYESETDSIVDRRQDVSEGRNND